MPMPDPNLHLFLNESEVKWATLKPHSRMEKSICWWPSDVFCTLSTYNVGCLLWALLYCNVAWVATFPRVGSPLHPYQWKIGIRWEGILWIRAAETSSWGDRSHQEQESITSSTQIAVATVAGPQRSGKSFLSNRLLKRMSGFAIGPSTTPCTKGLWIWGEPVAVS